MKAIQIKLKYAEIEGLDKWLEYVLAHEHLKDADNAEKCAWAIIAEWRFKKLKPKLHYFTNERISFKLHAPLAFAMAHIITSFPLNQIDYLGNALRRIAGEIDQHFQ